MRIFCLYILKLCYISEKTMNLVESWCQAVLLEKKHFKLQSKGGGNVPFAICQHSFNIWMIQWDAQSMQKKNSASPGRLNHGCRLWLMMVCHEFCCCRLCFELLNVSWISVVTMQWFVPWSAQRHVRSLVKMPVEKMPVTTSLVC